MAVKCSASITLTRVNDGATGATGNGVSKIEAQYYLSTSKTSQVGGSWKTTPDTWSVGKYMWIRHMITYTNGTTTYTNPVCDSGWEATNEIKIGGSNLMVYSQPELLNGAELMEKWKVSGGTFAIEVGDGGPTINRKVYSLFIEDKTSPDDMWACLLNDDEKLFRVEANQEYTLTLKCHIGTNSKGFKVNMTTSDFKTTQETLVITKDAVDSIHRDVRYTFKSTITGLVCLCFYNLGTVDSTNSSPSKVYFTDVMFTKGNVNATWGPSIKDLNRNFDMVYEYLGDEISNTKAAFNSTFEKVDEKITQAVAKTTTIETDMQIMQQTLETNIQTTSTGVLTTVSSQVKSVSDELNAFENTVTSYMSFTQTGLELGKTDSKFKANLTNEKLSFTEDNNEVAYISNKKLHITNADIANSVTIGKFAFVPRSNGNTSIKWIG